MPFIARLTDHLYGMPTTRPHQSLCTRVGRGDAVLGILASSLRLPTDQQPPRVIPRSINEMVVLADDLEPLLPKLPLDDGERYLVSMFRFGRARRPVDDDDIAARPKRLRNLIEYPFRIAEFVIGVADKHCVHSARWQARIPLFSDDGVNVVLAPQ